MRNRLGPQHREVRLDHLVGPGQVQPDLKELHRVGLVLIEQREHFRMHDPAPGSHPLHISAAEPRRGTERVAVVDVPAARQRHRLKSPVRMLGKAGHGAAVVHAPPVQTGEVIADLAAGERRRRPHRVVALWIVIEVMDAEQKGINGGPGRCAEGHGLQYRRSHGARLPLSHPARSGRASTRQRMGVRCLTLPQLKR